MKKRLFIRVWAIVLALIICLGCSSCAAVDIEPPEKTLAEKILLEMSLEEKVGQLFLLHGYRTVEENLPAAAEFNAGGIILFAEFFEDGTPGSATENIAALQAASKLPMFMGVDEEGGEVSRISIFEEYRSETFKSPRELMKKGGAELVREDTAEKCELLKSMGLNLNLAPVSDVSTDKEDFIYSRSAGNAKTAEKYVKAFVEESVSSSVGCCLKHFPGYGNNVDTHFETSVDKRSYESFEKNDFIPVSAGIEAGVGMVMVSHNTVECMDAESPASLSEEVHRILREELGFEGVIVTDDLGMKAIAEQYGIGEAAVIAIESGNDMITTSNLAEQYEALLEAVQSGRINEARLDRSVLRVLEYKVSLGIITEQ